MIACFDVDYQDTKGHAACLVFDHWQAATPFKQYTSLIPKVADYEAGQFYKRELPCLITVYEKIAEDISVLLLDSHVWLDHQKTPGLGAYFFEELERKIPLIGVAKNPYKDTPKLVAQVKRGKSQKPLYVSAVGMPLEEAIKSIRKMHGPYRIPTLLKEVDQLARKWPA